MPVGFLLSSGPHWELLWLSDGCSIGASHCCTMIRTAFLYRVTNTSSSAPSKSAWAARERIVFASLSRFGTDTPRSCTLISMIAKHSPFSTAWFYYFQTHFCGVAVCLASVNNNNTCFRFSFHEGVPVVAWRELTRHFISYREHCLVAASFSVH